MLDPEAMARLEQARDLWNSLGRGRIDNLDAPTLGVIADALKRAYEAGVEDAAGVLTDELKRAPVTWSSMRGIMDRLVQEIRALKGNQ